jgi:hypothetical protein
VRAGYGRQDREGHREDRDPGAERTRTHRINHCPRCAGSTVRLYKKSFATSRVLFCQTEKALRCRDPSRVTDPGKHAQCGSTAGHNAQLRIHVAYGTTFAQDANSGTSSRPANPPSSAAWQDGPQSPAEVDSTPLPSSTGRYDPATTERLRAMRAKNWGLGGSLSPP